MNKFQELVLISLICLLVSGISACNLKNNVESNDNSPKTKKNLVCDDSKYSLNYDKYKNSVMYNYNVEIKSPNVIERASEIRNRLAKLKDIELESFSTQKDYANIRLYLPYNYATEIDNMFANDSDITNFSKSSSNIGDNYIDYYERYVFFDILLNNFDEIEKMAEKDTCDKIDLNRVRRMIEENSRSYESSYTSYKKQLNKINLQIYVRNN